MDAPAHVVEDRPVAAGGPSIGRLSSLAILAVAGAALVLVEDLARGGVPASSLRIAVLVGALWSAAGAGLLALAALLRRLLPPDRRGPPWPLAALLAFVLFVSLSTALATELAARFRDPALVALSAAVLGVGVAWIAVLVSAPLAARLHALGRAIGPRTPRPALVRVSGAGGLIVVVSGLVALIDLAGRRAVDVPASRIAVYTLARLAALTDLDGDGDGLLLPPRDCAPLDPDRDGKACLTGQE